MNTGASHFPSRGNRPFPLWSLLLSLLLLGALAAGAVWLFRSGLLEESGPVPPVQSASVSVAGISPAESRLAASGSIPAVPEPDLPPPLDAVAYNLLRYRLDRQLEVIFAKAEALSPVPEYDPAWEPLIDRLVGDGFNKREMQHLFARLGPESYSPSFMAAKVTELHGVGGIGLSRYNATESLIPEGYVPPVADVSVGSCLAFMREHEKALDDIEAKHGVPRQVVIAVLLIETGAGLDLGSNPALRALASMAITGTPEALAGGGNSRQAARVPRASLAATLREKSNWAYNETAALIRYSRENDVNICRMPGSMYGAVGLCQFMPSNILPYGVDGDGDGKVDLFSVVDAMYSVANYLEAHGWRGAATKMQKHRVILTYNKDYAYAEGVLATANRLDMGLKGKASAKANAVVYAGTARLDPSLRRGRPVPRAARIKELGGYQELLQ